MCSFQEDKVPYPCPGGKAPQALQALGSLLSGHPDRLVSLDYTPLAGRSEAHTPS